MDVIIVSKTHMSNAACVGGVLANGRFVRLLDADGYNQDSNTQLSVGEVYSIVFSEKPGKRPPHVEDILVHSITFKFSFDSAREMIDYLKEKLKVKIWKGSSDVLFDGNLQWTNSGSGFISENGGVPINSVGFWVPDKDLTRKDFSDKVRYSYPLRWRNIPFVGFQIPVDLIPAGTLVRISLARWWSPNGEEERCYLQISGWYDLPEKQISNYIEDEEDDDGLPF